MNGERYEREVEPRTPLSDFLRHDLELTGTKVGCEHGVCGACTVQLDGEPVRSCLLFAAQVGGRSVRTIEGLAEDGEHPLQRAFHERHALQCGFCTAGFLMSLEPFVREQAEPADVQIREALAGNLCRCTGYRGMVEAVGQAAKEVGGDSSQPRGDVPPLHLADHVELRAALGLRADEAGDRDPR